MIGDEYERAGSPTQGVYAETCGVTRERLNRILRGRIEQISVDTLLSVTSRLGIGVDIVRRET